MVLLQFLYPAFAISQNAPVSGQHQIDLHAVNFVQAREIELKRIGALDPTADVGCYVDQYMVSGQKKFVGRFVQTGMALRVSGGRNGCEVVAPVADDVPVILRRSSPASGRSRIYSPDGC